MEGVYLDDSLFLQLTQALDAKTEINSHLTKATSKKTNLQLFINGNLLI